MHYYDLSHLHMFGHLQTQKSPAHICTGRTHLCSDTPREVSRGQISHIHWYLQTETLVALQITIPLILSLSSISLKWSFCIYQLGKSGSFSGVTKSCGIFLKLCISTSMFWFTILPLYHSLQWGWADESDLWDVRISSTQANISSALGEFSDGSFSLLLDCCMLVNFVHLAPCVCVTSRSGAASFPASWFYTI